MVVTEPVLAPGRKRELVEVLNRLVDASKAAHDAGYRCDPQWVARYVGDADRVIDEVLGYLMALDEPGGP